MNVAIIGNSDLLEVKNMIKTAYEDKFKIQLNFLTDNDNLKADILIIDSSDNSDLVKKYINKLHDNSIVIANIDEPNLVDILYKESINIVSFGFNPKSSITISSFKIGNTDTLMLCVQRDILTIYGQEFSEQEFIINSTGFTESEVLLIVSAHIVLGLSLGDIQEIFLRQLA